MVKVFTQEHTYKHPWERVTAASWRKYNDPHPLLNHVIEVDTVERRVDASTGRLHSDRLITLHAPGPAWVRRIVGESVCHTAEHSEVDAKAKYMEMKSRNITMNRFLDVQEKCVYMPHPENPDWTLMRQETAIQIQLPALTAFEKSLCERMSQNAYKGRQVMEQVCSFLEAEMPGLATI